MKIEIAKLLAKAAETLCLEAEVREDYSGRGMYGKQTAAIVFDQMGELMAIVAKASQYAADTTEYEDEEGNRIPDTDDLIEEVQKFRFDSMGRSSQIVY